MKILVIDEEFPWPQNSGKRTRSFSLTRALVTHGDVSYLAYGDPRSAAVEALTREGITCHAVAPPDRRKAGTKFYVRLLRNLASPLPYLVTSHWTQRFVKRFAELLREPGYDVVICEWTPYAIFLRDHPGLCSVIVAHNIEAQIWRRYEATESQLLHRWYISVQRKKVEDFERECFGWARGATAVSRAEAEEIASYGVDYPVEVVDNGVDIEYFHPNGGEVQPDSLVFSGALDYRPNQDAMEYFVHEIYPQIRAQRPAVTLTIVGREPPKHIRALGKIEGVTVTGTVDDVRPYLGRAALCVVPLRIGGGSRLKILAAMAMQLPVISTTIGAEGLEVHDGENIVLADGPDGFAAGVLAALENRERMASIARAGRELVERRYRWDTLGTLLFRYLEQVVGAGASTR